jgi:ureidoacrylate peracid hydrolase
MQVDYIKDSLSKPEMSGIIKRTRALIDLAHSLSMSVIYTKGEYDPNMALPPERAPYLRRGGTSPKCPKGSPEAEIIEELKPTAADHIITKVRSSAFHETKLDTLLRVKGIWILLVAGGSVNWGVDWLARDAKSRDIVTVALKDCTYSGDPAAHAASLANIDDFLGYVMNSDEVTQILSKAKRNSSG